jgi:hypothetical protein
MNRSPFEKFTVTPGVNRPFTSSTASVARSPETIRLGSNNIRAPEAAGGVCRASAGSANTQAAKRMKESARPGRRKDMREIVVENVTARKQRKLNPSSTEPGYFLTSTGSSSGE